MKNRNRNENRKLNILQVHNFYREAGGEDVVARNEAIMLKQHGHKVVRYYRSNNEIDELPMIQKIMLPFDSVFSIRTYSQIRRIIREQKIDLVHVHNTLHLISPSVFYAAKKEGVPVIMTVHNYRLCCPAGTFYKDHEACEKCMEKGLSCAVAGKCYRNSLLQSAMLSANTFIHRALHTYKHVNFICLTEFQKEKLCKLPDVLPKNVFIKPNFANACDTSAKKRKNQILYVGRLDESKGILDLLKAYYYMKLELENEEHQVPGLVICGEGKLYFECRGFAKRNGLKNVKFLGQIPREQVLEQMNTSKCVVVPSRWYEGMPMVLVEAYRTKTPVVAPDFGCFSAYIKDGVNGFKYEPYHIMELASLLAMMSARPWEMTCDFSKQEIFDQTEFEANYQQLMKIYGRCLRRVRIHKKKSIIRK